MERRTGRGRHDSAVRHIDLNDAGRGPSSRRHNTELVIITYTAVALFMLLIGYLVYLEVFRRADLNASPYNTKQERSSGNVIRGSIVTDSGAVLALTNVDGEGRETRSYPYENIFAHVIGYASNGKAGLEASLNYDLLTSHSSLLEQIRKEDEGTKVQGDKVVVTLDEQLQQTAYYALGSYRGAVVAIEPSTGKILAMVSKPDFNPNAIGAEWENMVADESSSALLNRASQGLYPPGSIFKIVTALAYMRENPKSFGDFSWDCGGFLTESGVTINCYQGESHGQEDLSAAFAHSCNTAFASIGLQLDNQALRDAAEDCLFNNNLPSSMQHSTSVFKLTKDSSEGEQMTTAIGQGETLVTPLHMALITAAIANGGILMRPYLVDRIETYDGDVVTQHKPSVYRKILTPNEAGTLTGFMENAVTSGTAYALDGAGYPAAGKTGSAEYVRDGVTGTHSWFCGFAGGEEPDICVAIIAEDGGTGSATAVPIARRIFDTYYYG